MNNRHVLFITTWLLLITASTLGYPRMFPERMFPETTNLTRGNYPCPWPWRTNYVDKPWHYCPWACELNGKKGTCVSGIFKCVCKLLHEERGSIYLELVKEMSMEKPRRAIVEHPDQKNNEYYFKPLSKRQTFGLP